MERCRAALKQRSIHHTGVCAYASPQLQRTDRLEAGVNLRLMQEYLGHASPTTTSLYTHLTVTAEALGLPAINRIMSDR